MKEMNLNQDQVWFEEHVYGTKVFSTIVNSNRSISSLLIVIHLFISSFLTLFFGFKTSRKSISSLGFSFLISFLLHLLIINFIGLDGITGLYSAYWKQDLCLTSIIILSNHLSFSFFSLLFFKKPHCLAIRYLQLLGLYFFNLEGSLCLSISILSFINQFHSTSYFKPILISLIALTFTLISYFNFQFAILISFSTIASFLFFLALDLIINQNFGIGLAWRVLLDHNRLHQSVLRNYYPPVSTRILIGVSWLMILVIVITFELINCSRSNSTKSNSISNRLSSPTILQSIRSTISSEKDPQSQVQDTQPHDPQSTNSTSIGTEPPTVLSSELRTTTTSNDTGLSAIPELTEASQTESIIAFSNPRSSFNIRSSSNATSSSNQRSSIDQSQNLKSSANKRRSTFSSLEHQYHSPSQSHSLSHSHSHSLSHSQSLGPDDSVSLSFDCKVLIEEESVEVMSSESVSNYLRIAHESQREDEGRVGGTEANEANEGIERTEDQETNQEESAETDENNEEKTENETHEQESEDDHVDEDHTEISLRRDLHLF